MLELAYPKIRGRWRKYRGQFFDRYRWTKMLYALRQRRLPLRALNFAIYQLERKRAERVHYFPPLVQLDANSRCNLKCPGCATGIADPEQRTKGLAPLEFMKAVIDQAAPRALQVSFYHWGEALLSKDFYPACQYADQKGLWTTVHSNLSFHVQELAQKVVSSGLRNLVVSCDGASQEVYERYRVGGNVDLVFENLRAIAEEKRRQKANHPWITAKFLVFDHNWHEMRAFRERALAAGADEVLFGAAGMGGIYKTHRAGTGKNFDLKTLRWESTEPGPCFDTWDYVSIDWDGGVYPCCLVFREEDLFVEAKTEGVLDLMKEWNNPKYKTMRRFYIGQSGLSVRDLPSPCNECILSFAQVKREKAPN
jgi:MoaA/NifB/PqqE/SkfB family radical SAM enzyme